MKPGPTIALAAKGEPALCAHCALPVVAGRGRFCCPGCEAVFRFINDAGLDDYYRLRASNPPRPDGAAARESFALYDEPAMRERFVRETITGHAEADLVLEGLTCAALTGDARDVAGRVATELAIDEVEARATPGRKQAYVSALQLRGARVAVVGDGISDAPALAQVRSDAVLLSIRSRISPRRCASRAARGASSARTSPGRSRTTSPSCRSHSPEW